MPRPQTLAAFAHAIISARDTACKVALAKEAAEAWSNRALSLGHLSGNPAMPQRPGRPDKPELLPPRLMPRRSTAGLKGRIALLHSLAHIELNAIDMTWDLIGRSVHTQLPKSYFDDWVRVGVEEATHFDLVSRHLNTMGACYGDLPAHDGLWQTIEDTGDSLIARLAIVPLVLEARGLDVSPQMIERLEQNQDYASARIVSIIYNDEKHHVAFGFRWFRYFCERQNLAPVPTFHQLVRKHFRGQIKPPFNDKARSQSGLTPGFYKPLAAIGAIGGD